LKEVRSTLRRLQTFARFYNIIALQVIRE